MSGKKHTLSQNNYEAIWKKIQKDMERQSKLKMSQLGKISAIKINVLPKINFFFQMLSIVTTNNFNWNGEKSRVKFKMLQGEKKGRPSSPEL